MTDLIQHKPPVNRLSSDSLPLQTVNLTLKGA